MSELPKPPAMHDTFIERFPKLGRAWEQVREAEREGPLEDRIRRLVKLAVAVGSLRQGAVHSAARKALAAGATSEEIHQVLALAVSTLGFPSTVAAFSWVRDEVKKHGGPR